MIESGNKVFCDVCNTEIEDKAYVHNTGDCLCEKCHNESYEILSKEELLKRYE